MSALYTTRVSITLPFTLVDIADKIGRALDPDTGGAESFNRSITGYMGETPIYGDTISTNPPCTEEFKVQANYMLTNPQALFDVCSADYLLRWPEHTPPTFIECKKFIESIIKEDNNAVLIP